jgi:hypothetical protein
VRALTQAPPRAPWRAPHPVLARTADAAVHTVSSHAPRDARLVARLERGGAVADGGLRSWVVEEVTR